MLRDDFHYFVPAILIALYQVFWVWRRLPEYREEETEIPGDYKPEDILRFNFFKYLAYCFFIFQLVFVILPISNNNIIVVSLLRFFGYLMIVAGLALSLRALRVLGDNWSGMFVYRIKKGQKLATHDVYSLVRHPIYLAVILEITGFELVANSWLFAPVLAVSGIIFYNQTKREDSLLEKKFADQFKFYKNSVKKLIPRLI